MYVNLEVLFLVMSVMYIGHPWMKDGEASDKPIDGVVLSRLKQFRDMNKLKKVALKVKSNHSRFLLPLPIFS